MSEVAAIILAAGVASRFGSGPEASKVLAPLNGKPLARHVAEAAVGSRCRPVVVVTGHAAERVVTALNLSPLRFVYNRDFASGMASSLKAGLAALPANAIGAVILLGDMPLIPSVLIDALVARFEASAHAADAVVPAVDGRWGNPVLLSRSLFGAIETLRGDEGARKLLQGRRIELYQTFDDAITRDVDTRSALDALENDLKARSARPRA